MAYIRMAYVVMAHIVMACAVMAHVVMVYLVMAHMVIAYVGDPSGSSLVCVDSMRADMRCLPMCVCGDTKAKRPKFCFAD